MEMVDQKSAAAERLHVPVICVLQPKDVLLLQCSTVPTQEQRNVSLHISLPVG